METDLMQQHRENPVVGDTTRIVNLPQPATKILPGPLSDLDGITTGFDVS